MTPRDAMVIHDDLALDCLPGVFRSPTAITKQACEKSAIYYLSFFRTPVPGSKIVPRTAQERYPAALSDGVNNASFLLKMHFCISRFPILSSNVATAVCLSFPLFYRGNRHDKASRPYR
jgi:hypothetical protein